MSDLIFYTNPMSRGRIVRWMLEETGADYTTEVLDYDTTMKQEPYLSINPMGKVPAIKHGDNIVTECAAICAYLADAFPQANLAPAPDKRADYYRWLFFAAGPVEQAVTNRTLGVEPSVEQRRMVGYGTFDIMVSVLEHAVSANDYIAGDNFTAADVYVGSHVGWGLQLGGLPERPAFITYYDKLASREAHKRASSLDGAN